VERAVRVDISRSEVRVGRFKVGEAMDLISPIPGTPDLTAELLTMLRLRRWEQWHRDGRGWPVVGRGRLAVHAHPAISVAAVAKAIGATDSVRFSPVYYARAVGTSDLWHAVNPLGTPNWLCDGARPLVTVTLTKATITVTETGGKIHTIRRTKPGSVAGLGRLLRGLRKATGPDVDIVGAADVAYRDVLNALEAAVGAGYFDARIVSAQ
jgi:hypothetical protein